MFSHALIASAALMASAVVAESVGKAIVINACSYPVYMCNTPAADGGYTDIPQWIDANNGTYEQQWTELSNGDGWSIKLSKSTDLTNIMQYEYTFQNDGGDVIWYDLSDVNGNPWDGDWEITASSASGECNPKQQAYRYATDDAYGMQACPQDSLITVTLCSGESGDDAGAASASASVASETASATAEVSSVVANTWVAVSTSESSTAVEATSTAEPTTTAEASSAVAEYTTVSTTVTPTYTTSVSAVPTTTVESTTFATSTVAVHTWHHGGKTVTEVATAVVTEVVTATHWHRPSKRHEHHARRHAADRR